ncbi:hypothetical protein GCM10022251_10260 [Phytohabitans flavus]|uniref:Uncharacterized protein n=1 Tax=Phytohabitans flavus TaxID=1076124 RepID=A0A6F8XK34_9ACTN|nr:DUF6042 family protein [Phytohabitans flavus]BCB74176.1 hypothetical protein Pflav_005860 [Phytohabitans flavus]
MTERWQRALMVPSWIRWLPCSFAYLTVVPDQHRFSREAWSMLPWDKAVWCDPGSVDDWVAQAQRHHPRREADHAELHAREHYDRVVRVRAARVEQFTEMCRRRALPVPHTLEELLYCLARFGLFEMDGEWVTPRLEQNPIEVLPLTGDEIVNEERAQQDDRAVLVAITVRALAERTRPRWRRRQVNADLSGFAAALRMPEAEVRRALTRLGEIAGLQVNPPPAVARDRVRITVAWPSFARRFPFDDLPAPEHAV